MLVTPEFDYNDSALAGFDYLLRVVSSGTVFRIYYDRTGDTLNFGVGGNSESVAWNHTAGTTYNLSFGWDKNTFDGTNYLRVSINDSQTFDGSSTPTQVAPDATMYVGSFSTGNNFAAIYEGLTVYRRPLYDGTYGPDFGNGDEIAAIYNSGSFADPTEVTGFWDVVFCMPTDADTTTALGTTGQAWSTPHSSNLITPVDGFMTSTAWDNWTQEGTPSANATITATERIYNWGYQFTSDAANEGYYFPVTVSAGDDWVIRVVMHSDGTSVPKAILYDQTNGAEIGSLTGSTSSTKTAPDVFIFSGEAPAGCTSLRVKLVSTAASGVTYCHQVELYTNLITNPSLEGGAGDPWIPTGFSNFDLDAGDTARETTIVHSGADSLKFAASAATEFMLSGNIGGDGFYGLGIWAYGNNSPGITWPNKPPQRLLSGGGEPNR
jgi:hypothetical protein